MDRKELSWLDVLTVASFMLGYENLMENRSQSAQSDQLIRQNNVQDANDKQAQYLLTELGCKFDEQNDMLKRILKAVENENYQRDH